MDRAPDEHPLLPDLRTYWIERFDWRVSGDAPAIDVTLVRDGTRRRLRFIAPRSVRVDEGFHGRCEGHLLLDVTACGWEGIRVQWYDDESDPGMQFYAYDVVDLDAPSDAPGDSAR